MSTYFELPQTRWCLTKLRSAYPTVPVMIISDGDPDPGYRELGAEFAVEVIYGERLKVPAKGTNYLKRQLRLALDTESDRIIKIDPDSHIHRPFNEIPQVDFAGSRRRRHPFFPIVQGGCQLISRQACALILESQILDHPRYASGVDWSDNPLINAWVRLYTLRSGRINIDFLLADIMTRLGFAFINWPECGCRWMREPRNTDLRYAITHPHRITHAASQTEVV